MTDHAILLARPAVAARLAAEGADGAVLAAIAALAQGEVRRDQDRVAEAWTRATDDAGTAEFRRLLTPLLERANFVKVGDAEFQAALAQESVFQVRLHTEPAAYADLGIWRRGTSPRSDTVRRWWLFRRPVSFTVWDRVLLLARLKPGKGPAALRGPQLKLFADIPDRDLEIVLPDTEVRMRTVDKLVLVVPALFGIGAVVSQLMAVLVFLSLLILGLVGLSEAKVEVSQAQLAAFGAAVFFIAMFITKQISRYRLRRLTFLRTLGETLYGRTLDSGAGAIHHLAELAADQDAVEAMLAWSLLRPGPATATELDAAVERWLASLGSGTDFEVDDALARCARWGIAEARDGRWHAADATAALAALRTRWGALLPA
jgi:hypothetical protein